MKFSLFSGLAALAVSAVAMPQPAHVSGLTQLSKRLDINSALGELTSDVGAIVSIADDITAKLKLCSGTGGVGIDTGVIAGLTGDLLKLNVSVGGVASLLADLGLGGASLKLGVAVPGAGADVNVTLPDVVGTAGSVVSGAVSGLSGLLSGLLCGIGKLTGGVVGTVAAEVPAVTSAVTTTALTGLTSASGLTNLLGTLLATVGGVLGSLTVAISTSSPSFLAPSYLKNKCHCHLANQQTPATLATWRASTSAPRCWARSASSRMSRARLRA